MNAVDGLEGGGKKMGAPVVHSGRIVVINHAKRDWGGMVTRESPTLPCLFFLTPVCIFLCYLLWHSYVCSTKLFEAIGPFCFKQF